MTVDQVKNYSYWSKQTLTGLPLRIINDKIGQFFQISEIFRPFGCLSTVRLIRPGKEIPLDLRNHTAKHPEIGGQTCVVVEFDKTEDCQMAHKTLGKKAREDNNGWEYNLLGKNNLISKIFYDFSQGVAGIQDGKLKK